MPDVVSGIPKPVGQVAKLLFMISRIIVLTWSGWVALGLSSSAAESTLADTRLTMEKLVQSRQLISKTQADWQADKEILEQTIQLFERELKLVEEQMSKLSTNSAQVEKERVQAETSRKASEDSLGKAREFATTLETEIKSLVPRLPVPLQDILKPMLNKLPADAANTKMAATERTQVLVGILNELDKFNNGVAIFSEKRKNDKGDEVAVETVYIGLGAAYFVNEADDFAGLGSPGSAGWEWTNQPEIAASVREVIRIYRNERAARFVPLPATIR
jgi:hypothetical protein